jgi:GntR family transcriptional regulator
MVVSRLISAVFMEAELPTPRKSRVQETVEAVLELIEDLPPGDGRLPSETDIAERCDVSRVTVREALSYLERQGLVLRKQGLGTFINRNVTRVPARLDTILDIGQLIRLSGREPGISLIQSRIGPTTPEIAKLLKIDVDQDTLTIDKVFSANKIPAVYVINVIPLPADNPQNDAEGFDPAQSVYNLLQEHFQESVAYQIADIDTHLTDDVLAEHLDYGNEKPLLIIEEVGYNQAETPIVYCREYYRPGVMQFQLLRKPG